MIKITKLPPALHDNLSPLKVFSVSPENKYNFEHIFGNIEGSVNREEKELWRELLKLSIEDYMTGYRNDKEKFSDAFEWFFNNPSEEPGSFLFVCDSLGLHPKTVLKPLINWTQNQRITIKNIASESRIGVE